MGVFVMVKYNQVIFFVLLKLALTLLSNMGTCILHYKTKSDFEIYVALQAQEIAYLFLCCKHLLVAK